MHREEEEALSAMVDRWSIFPYGMNAPRVKSKNKRGHVVSQYRLRSEVEV